MEEKGKTDLSVYDILYTVGFPGGAGDKESSAIAQSWT